MTFTKPILVAVLGLLLAAGLSACRDSEQGRPMAYEKGVYGGQQDESLSDEARERLRQRHQGQRW